MRHSTLYGVKGINATFEHGVSTWATISTTIGATPTTHHRSDRLSILSNLPHFPARSRFGGPLPAGPGAVTRHPPADPIPRAASQRTRRARVQTALPRAAVSASSLARTASIIGTQCRLIRHGLVQSARDIALVLPVLKLIGEQVAAHARDDRAQGGQRGPLAVAHRFHHRLNIGRGNRCISRSDLGILHTAAPAG